jgi:hypothetical protein
MFRLYLGHLQALKGQIHTISEQCILGSATLTMIRLYNNETACGSFILPVLCNIIILCMSHCCVLTDTFYPMYFLGLVCLALAWLGLAWLGSAWFVFRGSYVSCTQYV